ncbi:MAG: phosphate ABC transporter ATP-binding protein [Casimicrobiaceae bacterium]
MSARRDSLLPLVLEAVCFRVGGRQIIDHINLTIGPEGNTVILGANGAGKSVLLRLCHGLLPPTSGAIRWRGAGATSLQVTAIARRQAMVFQKAVVLRRSALANVTYALSLLGVRGSAGVARAMHALERVGLGALAHQSARALSGGEQQRLAIARAWSLQPDVLFLDEPTASLDPAAAEAIEQLIGAIAQSGTKIVMTTHHLALAARIASEVIFLHHGRVIEQTPAREFFRTPKSAEAGAFMRAELPSAAIEGN